jgi:hypothetical protein
MVLLPVFSVMLQRNIYAGTAVHARRLAWGGLSGGGSPPFGAAAPGSREQGVFEFSLLWAGSGAHGAILILDNQRVILNSLFRAEQGVFAPEQRT